MIKVPKTCPIFEWLNLKNGNTLDMKLFLKKGNQLISRIFAKIVHNCTYVKSFFSGTGYFKLMKIWHILGRNTIYKCKKKKYFDVILILTTKNFSLDYYLKVSND